MSLTVLNVAYPFAPVSKDSVGEAEQILWHIDNAITQFGHKSLVIACSGSRVAGTLIESEKPTGIIDSNQKKRIFQQYSELIRQVIWEWPVDLIHMHGIDFHEYLPPAGLPVLVTLHLPPIWYNSQAFRIKRLHTYLHCVSESQRRACPPGAFILPEIPNGVPVDELQAHHAKREYAVAMGRICPEKNFHTALEAARIAGIPLLLGGDVYPYPEDVEYFEQEIKPRLNGCNRFIGPVSFERKRRLLSGAKCLLLPTLAPEASSLISMEAIACGTPVIAYPSGAIPEIVEHNVTGFLVTGLMVMAEAIVRSPQIDAETCRNIAKSRFSVDKMIDRYLNVYRYLTHNQSLPAHTDPIFSIVDKN